MIKKIMLLFMFIMISMTVNAQYRALSISSTNGVGITEKTTFHSLSVNFHYDINDDWYLSKWSGISYDAVDEYQRWFASDVSINKYLPHDFSVGTGIQYRYAKQDDLSDIYWTIKIQKVIRFE